MAYNQKQSSAKKDDSKKVMVSKAGLNHYKAKSGELEATKVGNGNSVQSAVDDFATKNGINKKDYSVFFETSNSK